MYETYISRRNNEIEHMITLQVSIETKNMFIYFKDQQMFEWNEFGLLEL